MVSKVKALIGRLLIGTAIATPAQQALSNDSWSSVRQEIESLAQAEELPTFVLHNLTNAIEMGADIESVIRISYAQSTPTTAKSVDAFWLSQTAILQNPALFQAFLKARESSVNNAFLSKDTVLQNWVRKAFHKEGHYDNGGGNDDK